MIPFVVPTVLLKLKPYWKYVVGGLLVILATASIVNSIYDWGYRACKAEWVEADQARTRLQEKQSKEFTDLSKAVSDAAKAQDDRADKDLAAILSTIKNKPLYKVVDGKCYPSDDFQKTYLSIVGNK